MAGGRYVSSAPRNLIPTSDGAGEVVAVGASVTRFAVGDRVCPTFFPTWLAGPMTQADTVETLGGSVDGVLAELVACDADAAVRIPAHLSFEQAACLPCAGVTAWSALYAGRPLRLGETVLTLGTGGVSSFAVQIAAAAGARVIATSSSDAKLEIARRWGASATINYVSHPEWQKEVLRLTDGRGVDHVVDIGGGGTVGRSIASTAISGQVSLVGVLAPGEINPGMLYQWKTLQGVYVGSRAHFEELNRMLSVHRIVPHIDHVFGFNDARAAYERLQSGQQSGKLVIRIVD